MRQVGEFSIIEARVQIGKGTKIRTHNYIYHDVVIGKNGFIGHFNIIREFSRIGDNASISNFNQLYGHLEIGDDVKFPCDVHVCQGAKIGDRVFIAPRTTLLNTLHPLCPKARECVRAPVIEDDVKIGANCTISPGVTIGRGSLIGASTAVTVDIPPMSVVVGNPCRIIKIVKDLKCRYGLVENPYEGLL